MVKNNLLINIGNVFPLSNLLMLYFQNQELG